MIINPGLRRSIGPVAKAKATAPFRTQFHNATLVLARGTGNPTFTRATTKTMQDWERLITLPSGAAPLSGSRTVYNQFSFSETLTNAYWNYAISAPTLSANGSTPPTGVGSSFRLQLPSGARWGLSGFSTVAGHTYVYTGYIRTNGGVDTGYLWAFGTSVNTRADFTATASWKRISLSFTATATESTAVLAVMSDTTLDVLITGLMVEDVTGQSNQNPSEYVSVGVLSAPFHGSGIDGFKSFPYQNGNTVNANVVTEAQGAPLSGIAYYPEPTATNICLQSNAFTTTWADIIGTGTATQNAVGPDGVTNSAWTITDSDASNSYGKQQNIALTAATYTWSIFIKKTSGATTFPVIQSIDGTVRAIATIDTNNGVATAWTGVTGGTIAAGLVAGIENFNASFWRVRISWTGNINSWAFRLNPAATTNATQSTGALDATVQGSAVFFGSQLETGAVATSYIPTTTGSAARNADDLQYTLPAITTTGTVYAEVTTPISTGSQRHLLAASGSTSYFAVLNAGNSQLALHDGTALRLGAAYSVGTVINKCVNAWSPFGNASTCVNGGSVTQVTFDNDFNAVGNFMVGGAQGAPGTWNGKIYNVLAWLDRKPDALIQAMAK